MPDFALTTTGIVLGGYWQNLGAYSGATRYRATAKDSEYCFRLTLTTSDTPTIRYMANTTSALKLIVDGVTTTPTTDSSTAWATASLGTLAAGTHDITVKANGNPFLGIDAAKAVSTADAGATITYQPGFGGFLFDFGSGVPAYVRSEGQPNLNGGADGYPACFGTTKPTAQAGWKSTGNAFKVWAIQNDTGFRVESGGTLGTRATSGTGTAYGWVNVTSPSDGTSSAIHILYMGAGQSGTAGVVRIYQVAGTGTLDTSWSPPTRTPVAFYGNSITHNAVSPVYPVDGWPTVCGVALGLNVLNRGIGGTTVCDDYSTTSAGEARTADITGLSPAPVGVAILYGTNDKGIGASVITQAEFKDAYQNMMSLLTTNLSSAAYKCFKPIPRGDNTAAQMAAYFAEIDNAKAGLTSGQQAKVQVVETAPFALAGSAYNSGGAFARGTNYIPDDLHLSVTGNAVFAADVMPYVASAAGLVGYTVSLSASSGVSGSPITITYTRAGGSTWITGETVTTSDGASGTFGSFTHSNGTTATRTYTPASAGAKTLTHTNSQSWADPATSAFTATSPGPTAGTLIGFGIGSGVLCAC
jgi:lysophospholipase L1-like esterase